MKSRYETILESIANGEKTTITPTCRLEMFMKAYCNNEGAAELPEPRCREEEFWLSIIKCGSIEKSPLCKREVYLKAIANKETLQLCSMTNCKEEKLFRIILEKVCSNDSLNYVSNGTLYIREVYSSTQTDELLTLR